MASIDIMKYEGTRLVVVREMPQTLKKFILRGVPSFVNIKRRSAPMLKAEIGLAGFMIAHRGDRGKVEMPNGTVIAKIAFDAQKQLKGRTYGGMSYLDRLQKHQRGAEASLQKLKAQLSEVEGRGSQNVEPATSAFFATE